MKEFEQLNQKEVYDLLKSHHPIVLDLQKRRSKGLETGVDLDRILPVYDKIISDLTQINNNKNTGFKQSTDI